MPERLSDVTLQPIVFTFLFLYVFDSAIHIPGMRYQDYLLPMAFLGGTFVPIAGMRLVPRTIADYNPLSAIVAAIRQVTQGTDSAGSWPLQHPVLATVAYCALITVICLLLAVRGFRTPA